MGAGPTSTAFVRFAIAKMDINSQRCAGRKTFKNCENVCECINRENSAKYVLTAQARVFSKDKHILRKSFFFIFKYALKM